MFFIYKIKSYSLIQIDKIHRYNTNSTSLKTKSMNLRTNVHINVSSIKQQSTYVCKYDYIQVSRILVSSHQQR